MPTMTLDRDTDLTAGELVTTENSRYETYTTPDGHVTRLHLDALGQTIAMTNSAGSHYEYLRDENDLLYVIGYFQGTSFDKMLIPERASRNSLFEASTY